jgi:hypothetical protein
VPASASFTLSITASLVMTISADVPGLDLATDRLDCGPAVKR